MRYALLVEYDGSEFHGSQLQIDGVRTVQGELEQAVERIYGTPVRLSLASRTDTGVHASGQVAVFDGEERLDPPTLLKALNFHTPEDVSVRCVERVEDSFDPRRQAVSREYIYTINDGPAPSAIWRRTEVTTYKRLNVDDMNAVAEFFTGSHDFASFAGPATPADAVTVRYINEINVDRGADARVRVKIAGTAFLHQQVRRITGSLVRVSAGKLSPAKLKNLIEHPVRGAAGWPLGPQGLCLVRIEYGKDGPFHVETEYN